jgi:hypothetical protein
MVVFIITLPCLLVLLNFSLGLLVQAFPKLTNYPRIPFSSFFQFPTLSRPKVKNGGVSFLSVGYFGTLATINGLPSNRNAWDDWVVENLTTSPPFSRNEESRSAGENDTIPHGGLYISSNNDLISAQVLHILPAASVGCSSGDSLEQMEKPSYHGTKSNVRRIYLDSRPNGWGTGVLRS